MITESDAGLGSYATCRIFASLQPQTLSTARAQIRLLGAWDASPRVCAAAPAGPDRPHSPIRMIPLTRKPGACSASHHLRAAAGHWLDRYCRH
jgi:hypothetical protein